MRGYTPIFSAIRWYPNFTVFVSGSGYVSSRCARLARRALRIFPICLNNFG